MSAGGGERISVLHVDDEPGFAEMAAEFIEREDDRFSVEIAASASEGLEYLAEHDVDCVVSDYDMPGKNGIEFLGSVRDVSSDLPFILFTGKGSEAVASEAISEGVTDYLQKGTGTEQYELLANRIANVVEAHRSRRTLTERTRQLETLTSNLPGMVYRCRNESEWPMETIEGEVEELSGYTAETLESGDVVWGQDVLHPDDREQMWETVQAAIARNEPFEVTYRIVAADGTTKWMWERGRGVSTDDGSLAVLEGFITEITDRKQHEQQLERTNALLSTLFDTLPQGVIAEDESREVLSVNRRLVDLFELSGSPEELVGADCERLAEEASEVFVEPERFLERTDELVTERDDVDGEELALADGRTFERSYRPIELPDGDGHLWTYRDVTERENREVELREKSNLLDQIFAQVPTHLYVKDDRGRFLYVSEYYLEGEAPSFVDSTDVVIGKTDRELLGEFGEQTYRDDMQVIETEEPIINREEYMAAFDIWSLTSKVPWYDEDGDIAGVLGVTRRITDHKRYEQAISNLHDVATDLAGCHTRAAIYETTIEAARSLLDFERASIATERDDVGLLQAVAMSDEISLDERPSLPVDEGIAGKTYQTGDSFLLDDTLENDVAKPQAEDIRSALSIPIGDHGIFQAIDDQPETFDEDDLELAQLLVQHADQALDRLIREQELKAKNDRLEQFASIVSHDLRNPLQVAEGNLELARMEHDSEHLDEIEYALDRMEQLLEDLLVLSREGDVVDDPRPVELSAVVKDCWRTVETEEATLRYDEVGVIQADRTRLAQALENLFHNAIEHGGGDVVITVGTLEDDDGFYVEDDGPGVSMEEREQIFKEGYSQSESGTGLGLAIVTEIVEAHDWEIDVTESDDGGARFEITGVDVE